MVALSAMVPAAATPLFLVLWSWFGWWRRHRVLTYVLIASIVGGTIAAVVAARSALLRARVDLPVWVQGLGWLLVVTSIIFGAVADRQLGLRVRSFAPFFNDGERIRLITSGAFGVVRHPIYTAGIFYQLGALLASGVPTVAMALLVFALGAIWFTRAEERRLIERLEDPAAYTRYRARVPALLPWPRPRRNDASI